MTSGSVLEIRHILTIHSTRSGTEGPMILQASDPGISDEEKKALLWISPNLCLIPLRISDSSRWSVNLMGLLMLGEARNEGRSHFTPEKITPGSNYR